MNIYKRGPRFDQFQDVPGTEIVPEVTENEVLAVMREVFPFLTAHVKKVEAARFKWNQRGAYVLLEGAKDYDTATIFFTFTPAGVLVWGRNHACLEQAEETLAAIEALPSCPVPQAVFVVQVKAAEGHWYTKSVCISLQEAEKDVLFFRKHHKDVKVVTWEAFAAGGI